MVYQHSPCQCQQREARIVIRALQAKPNAAHYALAKFSIESIRHGVAPDSTFTLITQNLDGLSRRATDETHASLGITSPPTPPQPAMLEMHGRLFEVACTSGDETHTELDFSSPVCDALKGTEELVEWGAIEPNIPESDLPRCVQCGELARPGVVWFEEVPRYLDEIDDLVHEADLCIVVGTSSTVSPTGFRTFGPGHDLKTCTGVPSSNIRAIRSQAWWKGSGVQRRTQSKRQQGRFLVPGSMRGNSAKGTGFEPGIGHEQQMPVLAALLREYIA